MPEILTKHPKIVKELISDLGANCGKSAPQRILKDCPERSFCALPKGELCVLGLDQTRDLTQFQVAENMEKSTGFGFQQNPTIMHGWTGDIGAFLYIIGFLPFLCSIIGGKKFGALSWSWLGIGIVASGFWFYYGYINELLPNLISATFFLLSYSILFILKIIYRKSK
jgi:uncharacterized protein with PQ loop repeat